MKNEEQAIDQSSISALLIMGNIFLAFIYLSCTYVDENHKLLNWLLLPLVSTVLMAGFVFTYRDKKYWLARIVFAVFIVLSIIGYLLYAITNGMAYGFSHG
ncbi:hypothetical protein [Mucilaginibacter sp. L196]|uniref:hypothetical protein n=1 Tax=Mucilaginibacter sp. L196 TaxID=1641870 RepID=UPI001C20422A|nr:hypothetical protein [Mucilaginibacter sp. L196]